MDMEGPSAIVSRAKQFPAGEPNHDWGLVDLEQYAQAQHEVIVRGERTLTPAYWRLGRTLELIRRQRGRGAWGNYLESLAIHRVRACKARAIARHFSTPEAVAEMPVETAYEQAKQTRPQRRRGAASDEQGTSEAEKIETDAAKASDPRTEGIDDVQDFLNEVQTRADQLVDVAGFAERNQREALFPAYRAAMDRMRFLGRILGAEDESHTACLSTESVINAGDSHDTYEQGGLP